MAEKQLRWRLSLTSRAFPAMSGASLSIRLAQAFLSHILPTADHNAFRVFAYVDFPVSSRFRSWRRYPIETPDVFGL